MSSLLESLVGCMRREVIDGFSFLDGKPENHENALVRLAVIGRRLEEEKVIAMMGEISKCLEGVGKVVSF